MRSPSESEPPTTEAARVLASVAAALDTGAILLDGPDVLLANEAAVALRVVRGSTLVSSALNRLLRNARRAGTRLAQDVDLPWGAESRAVHAVAVPVAGTRQTVLLLTDLEEARRVEAVRRDFIANVSHELKTPVGALVLLAEATRDAMDDPPTARHFADRMITEAGRLARLVTELLDLSRLQGGEPLPTLAAIRVADVVAEAAEPLRMSAESAGVALDVGDMGELMVWGDQRLLVTALTNLIENAISYSPSGTKIGIGGRNRVENGSEEVEIAVSDQGVGIPKADQERVFERFYRIDTARSRVTGGTGLGLAIVKHIASNHGGRVSVWSQPGVGSTFTLRLPVPPTRRKVGAR